jgi:DNA-binding CsgD family transcriptional regulator
MTHQQIANLFGLSKSTVKNHVASMRKRIGTPGSKSEGAVAN